MIKIAKIPQKEKKVQKEINLWKKCLEIFKYQASGQA